jgi:hypothetical protein
VTEIIPPCSAVDRSITEVSIVGSNLDQVIAVSLNDTPCVLHPPSLATGTTRIVVNVPAYLIQDGQWHFALKTARGTATSGAPFTILPPPRPSVTHARPAEVTHSATEPASLEIEGRHFTRIVDVKLVGATGTSVCSIVRGPDPEPNDQRIVVRLAPDVRPGSYCVVVETRSGASDPGPPVIVRPDLLDSIDDLRKRFLRELKLENLEPALSATLEALQWRGDDLDTATGELLKAAKPAASISAEALESLHASLRPLLADPRARAPIEKHRQKSPDWIGNTAELALARFIAGMEPRVRAPSPAEVDALLRAGASALRLLQLAGAFLFDDTRARNLMLSFQTVLALYREKDLTHVLSKMRDHLTLVVGVTLPKEAAADGVD